MAKHNPFGDHSLQPRTRDNPFGEELIKHSPEEAAERMEQAARRVRALRSQLGSEGLTISATRDLIDEVSSAIEAAARAFRGLADN